MDMEKILILSLICYRHRGEKKQQQEQKRHETVNELTKVLHLFSVFFFLGLRSLPNNVEWGKVPANNNIRKFVFPRSKDTIRTLCKLFDWY